MENNTVQLLPSLLDANRRKTALELAAEVGVCHKTLLHILHDILGYRKFAARGIPHEISAVQWHHQEIAQGLLDLYQREGHDFLGRNIATDETWARAYEPNLKRHSKERSIPIFLVQRKCALRNVL